MKKEAPSYVSGSLRKFDGYYNYTATYRIDSDFPQGYQEETEFIWNENKDFNENADFSQGKFGLVVALISNCKAVSRKHFKSLNIHKKRSHLIFCD